MGFSDVPVPVPGQSDRQRELNEETLREWRNRQSVPLGERVVQWGPLLVDAGVIGDPSEAWDFLFVYALLDPPIPLRILDEVMALLPGEVGFSVYVELDEGYPIQTSGSDPAEIAMWFDSFIVAGTTTTSVRGQPETSALADPVEVAVMAADERDLRVVVPAYAIPARLLRGVGYDDLPLREMVIGVEIGTAGTVGGWAKPRDELLTTSAGWRFCRDVSELLDL